MHEKLWNDTPENMSDSLLWKNAKNNQNQKKIFFIIALYVFKILSLNKTLCCFCVLSCIQLFVIPWTVACKAPLLMGFSRQEY